MRIEVNVMTGEITEHEDDVVVEAPIVEEPVVEEPIVEEPAPADEGVTE